MLKKELKIVLILFVLIINSVINGNPVKKAKFSLNENSLLSSNHDLPQALSELNNFVAISNEGTSNFFEKTDDNNKVKDKKDGDDDDDDDKKNDKKEENNGKNDDKTDNKDEKEDKKDNEDKDDKKQDVDDKKNDEDKKDDKKVDDKKEEDKNEDDKDEKKETETKKPQKIDEKLDDNQKELKVDKINFDDSSEENDSHSNPETEEEGESESESDEDDKLIEEEESETGKNEKKLLIILASGFRYDYIHIKKLNAIKHILENGVRAKYLRPAYPSNSYPNYYSLMTGLHPIKHGFVDNEMYDTKYKENFPLKSHDHKHWWNKVEPLWVSAMKYKLKVATFWWKGACNIVIKTRKPKNCIPYKEKVSTEEVEKQLNLILDQFKENKLDLALLSYDTIDKVGHLYGPDSHKLRTAVRKFDSILQNITEELQERNLTETVNVVVVSDHGMIGAGIQIKLEQYVDFNDIEKFVNTGTFCMLLPEGNKEDYIFNSMRDAKIKGLNIYKKPSFPKHFHFKENINEELILPIVLTTDKGYYIKEPDLKKKLDEPEQDAEEETEFKGIHGYDALHVKEMNAAMFAFGPDLEKNKVVKAINQVDLYNLFCKLINIKPLKNDGDNEILDDFIHEEGDDHDNESNEENETEEDDDSEETNGEYGRKIVAEEKPIFRSRWASRGGSNLIKLNYLIAIFGTFICFCSLVRFSFY